MDKNSKYPKHPLLNLVYSEVIYEWTLDNGRRYRIRKLTYEGENNNIYLYVMENRLPGNNYWDHAMNVPQHVVDHMGWLAAEKVNFDSFIESYRESPDW